jgi:hypothetical protein
MKVQAILLVLVLFVLPVVITSPKNYVKMFHYITSHVGAWLKNYYQRWNDDSSGLARSEVLFAATILACVFVVPYGLLFILQGTPVLKYLASLIIWGDCSWDAQFTVVALLGFSCFLITIGVTVISCLIQSHFIKPNQIKLEQQ